MQPNKLYGVGLRHVHFTDILNRLEESSFGLDLDFFEIITENFFQTEGRPIKVLEKIREKFPVSFHGVSLSIASYGEIDFEYLRKVKELENRIKPFLVSDHLCWTGFKENNLHNLLPFPYDHENVDHIAEKIEVVQDYLKRPLLLENLSAYLECSKNAMTEAEFLSALHKKTGCNILLDLNNVYVNSQNFKFDPRKWLKDIPPRAVKEIHLAGFSDMGSYLFDTHSCPVSDPVWKLYEEHHLQFPEAALLVEWDEEVPSFETVLNEMKKAKRYES